MEMISIAISILSLIFSAFIFYKHEKKLKEQQIYLNDIAIKKACSPCAPTLCTRYND